jgi:hypothetical protein
MFKLYDQVKTDKGLTLEVIRITPDAVTLRHGLKGYIFEKTDGAIDGAHHADTIGKLLPPEHPHAALMLEYAKDWAETDRPWERWQLQQSTGAWYTFTKYQGHPRWDKHTQYRRKSKVITINGHAVPEPYRGALLDDVTYFMPSLYSAEVSCISSTSEDASSMAEFQTKGLMHTTKEAAIAHAKALLSFTAK